MSEELQKEIDRLKAENAKLTRDLTGLADDLKETRHEARDRRHETKTLAQQIADLTTDRDKFKAAAEADPEGLRKQLGDSAAQVRAMKHERAYEKVAKGLKVSDPTKLADLMKIASHQADTDEPDEASITATFQAALKGRPWLVDDAGADAPKSAPGGAVPKPGQQGQTPLPGADRGQSSAQSSQPRKDGKPVGAL